MADQAALSIDIGGTKLLAGLVDPGGRIIATNRLPTPPAAALRGGETLWRMVTALVDGMADQLAGYQLVGVGVGCGGPMQPGGTTVSPLNIPQWRDFPLGERLADLLSLPVAVDNDAKALALGEGWCGAARGERNFVAMVVSTGVGGGIVLDGRLLDGAGGNAGHIGHVVVEPEGRVCACGGRGCLEAEASGTSIAAITGHPAAQASAAMRERTGVLVGRAVASVANLLDLRLAVVAGSVALGFGRSFFAASALVTAVLCISGIWYFRRTEKSFADII